MTRNELFKTLKENDIYSLSMFVLYKLSSIPEYSVMGELPYILDKSSLINMCKYFGGRTIKIPTLQELDSVMHLVLLYQYVEIDGIPYEEAIAKVGYKPADYRKVKTAYTKLKDVLSKYNFNRG